jgi:hypothetical protein
MKSAEEPRISNWLHPEEELLWSGSPLPDVRHAVFTIVLFICMTGISVIALRYGLGIVFIFVIMGTVGIVGVISDEINRRKTRYALSNRRAFIVKAGYPELIRILPLDTFKILAISPGRNGKGTVLGRSTAGGWERLDKSGNPVTRPVFSQIDSVEHVYSLMVESRPELASTTPANVEPAEERGIRAWLLTGETLLWTGRPRLKSENDLTWRDALSLLLLGVYIVIGFGIVNEARETREPRYEGVGAVSDLTLAMLIASVTGFLLFGFYGGILHHFVDDIRLKRTFYGLTNQRAIVETPKSVRFVPLESITSIKIERDDRRGDTINCRSDVADRLVFRFVDAVFRRDRPFEGPLFRNIPEPEHVRALMDGAKAALAGKS